MFYDEFAAWWCLAMMCTWFETDVYGCTLNFTISRFYCVDFCMWIARLFMPWRPESGISPGIQTTMNLLEESTCSCPYCGERITLLIDGSVDEQMYIEDCQVCCRPMVIHVSVGSDGVFMIEVRHEND